MAAAASKEKPDRGVKRTAERQVPPTTFAWPADQEGNPMVQISMAASELVKTGDFSNVVVGPAIVTRFVEDGPPEDIQEELLNLAQTAEWVVGNEREKVLKNLQS